MGRGIILTAVVCSILIGFITNVNGWRIDEDHNPEYIPEDHIHTFPALYESLKSEVESFFNIIRTLVLDAEADIKDYIDDYVTPVTKHFLNQTQEDWIALSKELHIVVDNTLKELYTGKNDIFKYVGKDIKRILEFIKPKQLLIELDKVLQKEKNNIIDYILKSNYTNDVEFANELIEAIYCYPESKTELKTLLVKYIASLVRSKYSDLINTLRYEVDRGIKLIVSICKRFLKYGEEYIAHLTIREIEKLLKILIHKLFDEAVEGVEKKIGLGRLIKW